MHVLMRDMAVSTSVLIHKVPSFAVARQATSLIKTRRPVAVSKLCVASAAIRRNNHSVASVEIWVVWESQFSARRWHSEKGHSFLAILGSFLSSLNYTKKGESVDPLMLLN